MSLSEALQTTAH